MLEFLLKLTHKKSCKKEQCPCIQKQESTPTENAIQIPEKIVAEIDYEKLADAIVKANEKIEEKKKEKEQKIYQEKYDMWDKAMGIKRYNGKNKFFKILSFLLCCLLTPIGILLKPHNGTTHNMGTYKFFNIINEMSFMVYSFVSLIISIFCFYSSYEKNVIIDIMGISTTIWIGVFFLLIYGILDIARGEMHFAPDDANATTIFSSIMALNGVIVAILASNTKVTITMLMTVLLWFDTHPVISFIIAIYILVKIIALFFSRKEKDNDQI